jgi:hypothetical protein
VITTFLLRVAILRCVLAVALAAAVWLFSHDRLQPVETDQTAVATLVTSVLGVLWLAGLATGYVLRRPRP